MLNSSRTEELKLKAFVLFYISDIFSFVIARLVWKHICFTEHIWSVSFFLAITVALTGVERTENNSRVFYFFSSGV